jgi:predicted GIY-YIG superfamily endonuclease
MTHYVYRLYDATGDLLYVGWSKNPHMRLRQHKQDNPHWAFDVTRGRISVFPDRDSALAAEKEAIRTEHPFWNITSRWIHHLEWQPEHYIRWVQMLRKQPYSAGANKQRIAMALLVYRTRFNESMPPRVRRRVRSVA